MLWHLTILNNGLTINGLLTILDGYPLLKSFDIQGCLYVDFDRSLGKMCNAQIEELRVLSNYIDHKFNFEDFLIHVHMGLQGFFW